MLGNFHGKVIDVKIEFYGEQLNKIFFKLFALRRVRRQSSFDADTFLMTFAVESSLKLHQKIIEKCIKKQFVVQRGMEKSKPTITRTCLTSQLEFCV